MEQPSESSKVSCRIVLEYASDEEALRVHRSVSLDNEDYIRTEVSGNTIIAEVSASSLNSLLHTLDDFMACASVAEKIVAKEHHSE